MFIGELQNDKDGPKPSLREHLEKAQRICSSSAEDKAPDGTNYRTTQRKTLLGSEKEEYRSKEDTGFH